MHRQHMQNLEHLPTNLLINRRQGHLKVAPTQLTTLHHPTQPLTQPTILLTLHHLPQTQTQIQIPLQTHPPWRVNEEARANQHPIVEQEAQTVETTIGDNGQCDGIPC